MQKGQEKSLKSIIYLGASGTTWRCFRLDINERKRKKKWRQNYIRVEWSFSWSGQGLWRKDETYVLSSVLIKGPGLFSLSFSVIRCWLPPRQGYLGHGRYHYLKQVKRWLVTESLDCRSCKSWPRRIWVVCHEAHHVGSEAVCSLRWTSFIGSCLNRPESQGRGQSRGKYKEEAILYQWWGTVWPFRAHVPFEDLKKIRGLSVPPKWTKIYMHGISGCLSSSD